LHGRDDESTNGAVFEALLVGECRELRARDLADEDERVVRRV
jgi:hypothetical protein